jgi:hypothetical protein
VKPLIIHSGKARQFGSRLRAGLHRRLQRRVTGFPGYNRIISTVLYHSCLYWIFRKRFLGLQLGSGDNRIEGFGNIDARLLAKCDIVADVERIKLGANSVESFIHPTCSSTFHVSGREESSRSGTAS